MQNEANEESNETSNTTTFVKAYYTAQEKLLHEYFVNVKHILLRTKEKLSTVKKKPHYEHKNMQVMCE